MHKALNVNQISCTVQPCILMHWQIENLAMMFANMDAQPYYNVFKPLYMYM